VENGFVKETYRGCRLDLFRPSSQGSHSYHMALVCLYGVCTFEIGSSSIGMVL
jgi:hypothetical protein